MNDDIAEILLKVALNTKKKNQPNLIVLVLVEEKQTWDVMFIFSFINIFSSLHISGVMVGMLASSVVDCGFEPRLGQIKDYKIGICCCCAKQAALRRKS